MTAQVLGYRDINSFLAGLEEILGLLEGIGRVAESIKPLILKKLYLRTVSLCKCTPTIFSSVHFLLPLRAFALLLTVLGARI